MRKNNFRTGQGMAKRSADGMAKGIAEEIEKL